MTYVAGWKWYVSGLLARKLVVSHQVEKNTLDTAAQNG